MNSEMCRTSMPLLTIMWLLKHVISELVTSPVNTVVMSGSRAQLSCDTNMGPGVIEWTVVKTGKVINERLRAISSENGSYYLLTTKEHPGQVDVVIREVQSTDAGVYTCRERTQGRGASAALVVLHSFPICGPEIRGSKQEYFSIDSFSSSAINETPKCSISYSGDLYPIFRWHNRNNSTIDHKRTYAPKNSTDVKTTIVSSLITRGTSSIMMDLVCFITFSQPNMSHVTTNTLMAFEPPMYEFMWFASGVNPTSTSSPLAESTIVLKLSSQFLPPEDPSLLNFSEFNTFTKSTSQPQSTTRKDIADDTTFTESIIRNRPTVNSIDVETTYYNLTMTSSVFYNEAATNMDVDVDSMYGLITAIVISCFLLLVCFAGTAFYLVRNRRTILQTVQANPNSTDYNDFQNVPHGEPTHSVSLHRTTVDNDSREQIHSHDYLADNPESRLTEAKEDNNKVNEVMNESERHDYAEIEHPFSSDDTVLKTICTESDSRCTPTLPPERKYLSLKTYSRSEIFDETIEHAAWPKGYSTWKSSVPAEVVCGTASTCVHLNKAEDIFSHAVDMEALD